MSKAITRGQQQVPTLSFDLTFRRRPLYQVCFISEGSMVNMHQIYLQYVLFTCKLILSIEKETPKVLTFKFKKKFKVFSCTFT